MFYYMGVTRAVSNITGKNMGQGVQEYVPGEKSLVLDGESNGEWSKLYHFWSLDVVSWAPVYVETASLNHHWTY